MRFECSWDEWTESEISDTERPSDEHKSLEEAESERKRDYLSKNDKLCLSTGVVYYTDGQPRLRSSSSLRTWNLRPQFTRPNVIREHESLSIFFGFVANWSQAQDWKGSTDVSKQGAVDELLELPQVKHTLQAYFSLLDDPAKSESYYASALLAFETTIANAAQWDIFSGGEDRRTLCGGLLAFPVPPGSTVLPAIAGTSDAVVTNADGTRKIARELKTPQAESLHSGSFLVETLVTHLGHNAIATAAIAGDRVALYWTERGHDGIAEIHKFGLRDLLYKLNRRTFAHFITYHLALVAEPIRERPSLLHEPLLGQGTHASSLGEPGSPVSDQLSQVEDFNLQADMWTEDKVRGVDGSITRIHRLKDDCEIRYNVFKYI